MNARASRWERFAGTAPLTAFIALAGSSLAAGAAPASEEAPSATVPPVVASALLAESAMEASQESSLSSKAESSSSDLSAGAPLHWSSSAEYSGGKYRWSASRGALDVGLRFDAPNNAGRPFDFRIEGSSPVASPLPAISLGLRRVGSSRSVPASTLLERAAGGSADSSYVSKVGIEWKPAESNVQFLREGLGLRLDGGNRMTVHLRKGVLGVYMHRKF